MVVVEIRRPYFDEESQTIKWQTRGMVRATPEGVNVAMVSDSAPCIVQGTVVEASSGELVDPVTEPERWARSLVDAYRTGDLVAVVLHDDAPSPPEAAPNEDEPVIPEPPQPKLGEIQASADEVTTAA